MDLLTASKVRGAFLRGSSGLVSEERRTGTTRSGIVLRRMINCSSVGKPSRDGFPDSSAVSCSLSHTCAKVERSNENIVTDLECTTGNQRVYKKVGGYSRNLERTRGIIR